MELEVSYNENYCLEGRAERQRGATDRDDGGGQAVGTDCVDRHTLFITPLSSSAHQQLLLGVSGVPSPVRGSRIAL